MESTLPYVTPTTPHLRGLARWTCSEHPLWPGLSLRSRLTRKPHLGVFHDLSADGKGIEPLLQRCTQLRARHPTATPTAGGGSAGGMTAEPEVQCAPLPEAGPRQPASPRANPCGGLLRQPTSGGSCIPSALPDPSAGFLGPHAFRLNRIHFHLYIRNIVFYFP